MNRNRGRKTIIYPLSPDETPELTPISGLTLASVDQVGAEHTANQSPEMLSERVAITADEPLADDPFLKAMSDWSGTGRGSHVEFDHHEVVPLKQGQPGVNIDYIPLLKPI
jgi:hypothetical protein